MKNTADKIVHFVDELPLVNNAGSGRKLDASWRQPLIDNPGKWALLYIGQPPSRPSEKNGYEFAQRGGKLYGRYVGELRKGETP